MRSTERIEDDSVIHEVDSEGHHRLIINADPGEWFQFDQLATNGVYFARNEPKVGGSKDFPVVFTVEGIAFIHLPDSEDADGRDRPDV